MYDKTLEFGILNRKPVLPDGTVDLCANVFDYKDRLEVEDVILVSVEYQAKPSMISLVYYGSEDFADLLCYFNGISDPLSLKAGTYLFLPTLDSMLDAYKKEIATNDTSNVSDKLPPAVRNKIEKILSTNDIPISRILPPNVPVPGSTNTTVQDGSIILGTNSTVRCESPSRIQSLSKRIRQAVLETAK